MKSSKASTQPTLTIEVALFAQAAQVASAKSITLGLQVGATLGELKQQLLVERPELASLVAVSRWAVDLEFVDNDFVFESGAVQAAMIPPVSGG